MSILTSKQEAFVQQYMIDRNATQAAIRAGYSPKTARSQGQRLLTKVDIQSRLGELERKAESFAEKKADDVRERLAAIAWTDLTEIVDFDGQHMTMRAFESLTPAQRACIKDWKIRTVTRMEVGEDGKPVPVEVDMVEIKLHDKLKALELYAKHIGMEREAKKDAVPIFNLTVITEGEQDRHDKSRALPAATKASRTA